MLVWYLMNFNISLRHKISVDILNKSISSMYKLMIILIKIPVFYDSVSFERNSKFEFIYCLRGNFLTI